MKAVHDNGLIIERTFGAPRELIWRAWTDPEHIKQWWGPQGFHNSSCDIELRVGGTFRLTVCAPDGNRYPCQGTFREIIEPERIVYDSTADDSHPCGAGLPPRSTVTISFVEQRGGRTQLILQTRFENASRRDAANEAGFSTSWGEALERLATIISG